MGKGVKTWNERGLGDVRLLKHKQNGKIRLIMRQEKVAKIVLNHLVAPDLELTPQAGSDKAWTWSCYNYIEGEMESSTLAIKFKTPELATTFKEGVEAAKVEMGKVLAGEDAADTAAGDEAAAALGGATIFKAGADAADSDSDEEAQ